MTLINLQCNARKDVKLYIFYATFILFCCGLICIYPIVAWSQYVEFADIILNSTKWLYKLDFSMCYCEDGLSDITTFRSIGYPLIIALCKLLCGSFYLKAILILQILLWCYSSFLFWNFLGECRFKEEYKWFFLVTYLTGFGFSTQFLVFCSDGIFTSIFTILIVCCSRLILYRDIYTKLKILKCGLLLLLCFLIREVTLTISPIFISMFLLNIKHNIYSRNYLRFFIDLVIFFVPLIVFAFAQAYWNFYRSNGDFFVNLSERSSLSVPIEQAIILNQNILKHSVIWDEETKENIIQNINKLSFSDKLKIDWWHRILPIRYLQKKYGLTEFELTNLIKKEYWHIWQKHPKLMIDLMKKRLFSAPDILFIFRPVESLESYYDNYQFFNNKKNKKLIHFKDLKNMDIKRWKWQDVFFVVIVNLCRVISCCICLMCLGNIIWICLKLVCKNFNKMDTLNLFYSCIFIGYTLAYAAVHIEYRYLAAVSSLPIFIGLNGLQQIINYVRQFNINKNFLWYKKINV